MESALWNRFLSKMSQLADGLEQKNVGEKDFKKVEVRSISTIVRIHLKWPTGVRILV